MIRAILVSPLVCLGPSLTRAARAGKPLFRRKQVQFPPYFFMGRANRSNFNHRRNRKKEMFAYRPEK
jgi:hypothetical protein